MVKKYRLYYFGLIFVAIAWGSNFGVSRWAMTLFPPEVFVFLRFGLAVPILFLVLKWSEGDMGVAKRDLYKLAFIGLLGVAFLEIVVMYSIKLTTLANASLLNVAPWPIFAALLAPLFTQEKLTSRVVIGGILALIGVTLIILGGDQAFDLSSEYMVGNLLALSISLIGSIFNLLCMRMMRRYSALRISTWTIFFGSLFMIPATIGLWGQVAWTDLSALAWTSVVYNVVVCTVAAFVIWNASMQQVGTTKANFYRYIVPAAATVSGALFFAESILPLQMIGGIIIVSGLIWISREEKSRSKISM